MLIGLALLAVVVVGYMLVTNAIDGAEGMTSSQLRALQADRAKSAVSIRDKAKAENRDLTDEENEQIDGLVADAEALADLAAKAKTREDREAKLDKIKADLSAPQPRAGAPRAVDLKPDTAITSGMHDNYEDDKKAGFRDYGDFAAMVYNCSRNASLSGPWANRPEVVGAYGQNTFNGEDGGFLIPTEFVNTMYKRAVDGSALRQAVFGPMRKFSLRGNSLDITASVDHDASSTTYRYGGIVVYLVDEGNQITRSTAKVRKQNFKLHKMAALSFSTSEQLEDGGINGNDLLQMHADAMGEEWLEYALWGTGAGQPLGAFHANNAARNTVDGEAGQVANTIVRENVDNLEEGLWDGSNAGGIYLYNKEGRKYLRTLVIDVGTGGAPVPYFEKGPAGGADRLDGRPAYQTSHMLAIGETGDIGIIDPMQYGWATKAGASIDAASSIHLRFDYDEVGYRTTWRADGRPLWDRTYTPRKATSGRAESPYVILTSTNR